MLQRLHERAAECLAHADAMEQRAREMTNPETKANLFDTAVRWRRLAESYQFVERVEQFLAQVRRNSKHQGSRLS